MVVSVKSVLVSGPAGGSVFWPGSVNVLVVRVVSVVSGTGLVVSVVDSVVSSE